MCFAREHAILLHINNPTHTHVYKHAHAHTHTHTHTSHTNKQTNTNTHKYTHTKNKHAAAHLVAKVHGERAGGELRHGNAQRLQKHPLAGIVQIQPRPEAQQQAGNGHPEGGRLDAGQAVLGAKLPQDICRLVLRVRRRRFAVRAIEHRNAVRVLLQLLHTRGRGSEGVCECV